MSKKLAYPTPEEDAAIRVAAADDPDTIPDLAEAFAAGQVRRVGRPKSMITKQAISIRLDQDILDHYRGTGAGWQTRLNEDLRRLIKDSAA
jgi:uncharacterized protein (DUF4415 family)